MTFLLFAKLDQEPEARLASLKALFGPEDVSPSHTEPPWVISHSAI